MTAAAVVLPLALYAGLNYADYRTSVDAERRGGIELNSAVQTVGLKPMKIGGTLALTALDLLVARHHPRAVWVIRGMAIAGLGGVAYHNSQVDRSRR